MANYRNVTIFNNGSIGDFVMSLIVLDDVYTKNSKISCNIVSPRNLSLWKKLLVSYRSISLYKYPYVYPSFGKSIYIFPIIFENMSWHQKIVAMFLKILQNKVIAFSYSKTTRPIYLSDLYVIDNTEIFFADKLYNILSSFGIGFEKRQIILKYKNNFIQNTKPTIVFHPFGASDGRCFLGEKLDAIVTSIIQHFPQHEIILTGSKDDQLRVTRFVKNNKQIKLYLGEDIEHVIDALLSTELFIGVDTGITHIANSLQKRTLVLAEQGTPNWLPFYNPRATIIYKIKDSDSEVYEGKDFLFSSSQGKVRYLDRIPISVIQKYIENISREIKK